jgi:hypothetical protein
MDTRTDTTTITPEAIAVETARLRQVAVAAHAEYAQYHGKFDGWVLGRALLQIGKCGHQAAACELILVDPEITNDPLGGTFRDFHSAQPGLHVCGVNPDKITYLLCRLGR